MIKGFVHLHVHTEYSLLDGLSNIKGLLAHTKENQMDALAITDHGAMYGAIEFYKAAVSLGINPIIGMEGYMTNVNLGEKVERSKSKNYHLLLLAKNYDGYKNLMSLSTLAHLKGYYYRPRFDRKLLKQYAKGLICTSACGQGEIAQSILESDFSQTKAVAQYFLDVFGEDYYLEMQRHLYRDYTSHIKEAAIKNEVLTMADNEERINRGIVKLSREMGIPVVATNDAHYIKKEDARAQDALVCIATGKTVNDIKRLRFIDTPTFYMTTPGEMRALFRDLPEACDNTLLIADKCHLELTLGKWIFPRFSLPRGIKPDQYIKKLATKKLKERIPNPDRETFDRLTYEIKIINQKGYAPYFLIMMDMVNWANQQGIITNTRGSAAGSLVSYVLGITTVNPLTYYLPFERFLNPYRPSPPDIDLDIADDRRDEVITYICQKYGSDKVAQICTFGRMLSRAAVRDVARVLGYPYAIGDKIAKLIPPPKQGFPVTIPKAMEENSDLKNLYLSDKDVKQVLEMAMEIEGNARHISVHAAGIVVSPTSLNEYTPLQREPSGEKIITQYEMHACDDVGLIKFDILGIRNLSILGAAVKNVKATRGIEIDFHKLPLDDAKTFAMLGRGETMGTFQLGGAGMTKYLKDLKPTRIEDLMAMVALYRPGPIAVIPEYIKRKRDPSLVKFLDPRMKKFLGPSYGLIVYQDDLLFCALELAGYTWEEADKFRKAVGKKIPEEMAAQKEKFIKGIVQQGQTNQFAEELWKLFEPFQSYGFNKAHAASYGMVAYQTSYMKANYPVEYMTALLTAESNDKEKIAAAVNECKQMKVIILPPNVNQSMEGFKIINHQGSLGNLGIRFGFNAIKNVGAAAISAILAARKEGIFTSIIDFVSRVDGRKVNKKVLESLIKVGALSDFGPRSSLLSSLETIREKIPRKNSGNQPELFTLTDSQKASSILPEVNLNQIKEFEDNELEMFERQLLGFSLTAKPLDEILIPFENEADHKINELQDELLNTDQVKVAGIIREIRVILTKNSGQEMAFAKMEDTTGGVELVVFPKTFSEIKNQLVENQPLIVSGKVSRRDDSTSLILESIKTQPGIIQPEGLQIKIPTGTTKPQLLALRKLLGANPGTKPATLIFEESRESVKLPFGIKWDRELSGQISLILHPPLTS